MRKLLFVLAFLAGITELGTAVADACGAKFLVGSRGARYQRLLAIIKPVRILVYWKQDESTKKQDRWKAEATEVLEKAGHSVWLAFKAEDFRSAAKEGDFDVVMMPLDDARQLGVEVAALSPDSALLPVAYLPTRREYSQAKNHFGNVLKYPTTLDQLLRAVEKARKAAARSSGERTD